MASRNHLVLRAALGLQRKPLDSEHGFFHGFRSYQGGSRLGRSHISESIGKVIGQGSRLMVQYGLPFRSWHPKGDASRGTHPGLWEYF